MELKKYVRRGIFDETQNYKPLFQYDGKKPNTIIMLLEGRGRRKIKLSNNRFLYENFYPTTFIGLEDYILERSRPGGVGVYPGSHYVLWNGDDFMYALEIQPELARRAIFELSRRIRIYDTRKKSTDTLLKVERTIDIGPPQAELAETLYEMSFADEEEFPPHLEARLSRTYQAGEYLMRQNELSSELYILVSGEVAILHAEIGVGVEEEIDRLGAGQLVGEMAQFDGMPRSASGRAVTEVKALVFSPENFHMLFQLHPKWTKMLMKTLAERIDQRLQSFERIDLKNIHV